MSAQPVGEPPGGEQSAWRLEFARRSVQPYREHPGARIAVMGGSVAQGAADRWSDCDTIVYWDEVDAGWLETPRAADPHGRAERFTWLESVPGDAWLEQYRFGALKADVAHLRLGWVDELVDATLAGERVDTLALDVLRGVEEAVVLFGGDAYEPFRARVRSYPRELQVALVRAHLSFMPSWIYEAMGRERGDLVVFYEYVLATVRNLVGVLAGLNRVYVAPEKLKRVGRVAAGLTIAPPEAAARLDALLDLPRERVQPELDDLVGRTLDLVDEHLPEVDTAAARRVWTLPLTPAEEAPW